MNGVLVIDKPQVLTSHDVVAAARRTLGETKIGHTGTLDPLATGVLPLAIGRATRLVRFFAASDKDYEATIRFGFATDTYDIGGREISRTDAMPAPEHLIRALQALTGEYLQPPPAFSAKKVGGRRAYELARNEHAVALAPAAVRVARADLVSFSGGRAHVVLTCSAGFYVRSFAQTLGELTGTGACLEALRRTRSGEFCLDNTIPIAGLSEASRVASALIPLSALLHHLPAIAVNSRGLERVAHGRGVEPGDYERWPAASPSAEWVRLLNLRGELIGMGTPGSEPGSLHPAIVLM
jgi:tRNA pseudouridine55 synthase